MFRWMNGPTSRRTSSDPLRLGDELRGIVRQADPRVPVTNIKIEAGNVDQVMNQDHFYQAV
jgi:hypothetical protein